MTIRRTIASLEPLEIVTMFELDATDLGEPEILRWHPGTALAGIPIIWQGQTYQPFPIMAEGFELNASGTLPRPQIRASNIGGALGAYLQTIGEGLGAKLTRRRTLAKYLDGQPGADPTAEFPIEVYYIARRVAENPIEITLECSVAFDVQGVQLPRRQVIAGTCQWKYRGAQCGYAGPAVQDIYGNPTNDSTKDRCRKTLDACKARFGQFGTLRTSAFPASLLVR